MAKLETAIEYRERMVRRFLAEGAPDAPDPTPAEENMMRAYLRSPDYSPRHIAGMILDIRSA